MAPDSTADKAERLASKEHDLSVHDLGLDESVSRDVLAEPAAVASEPKIVVSPRLVALVSLVFGVACLGTLAFVAAVREADALSTVALALAIVAFAIQLLAAAAHNQSTSQQSLRSEQLNTQTRALLAEMQTTARATETMVREQFGQLLRAFMDAAKEAERGKHFDPDEFERRLMRNIAQQAVLATPERATVTTSVARARALERREAEERRRAKAAAAATPFPSAEEAQPLLADLLTLPMRARDRLREYRSDKIEITENPGRDGWFEGYPMSGIGSDPVDKVLGDAGLLQLVRSTDDEVPGDGLIYQLSDKGDLAARILSGAGQVPDWAEPLFRDETSPEQPGHPEQTS